MSEYTRRFYRTRSGIGLRRTGLGADVEDSATTPPGVNEAVASAAGAPASIEISKLPVWLWAPDQWENLDVINYVDLPAIGTTAVIVTFQVPPGRNGIIKKIANNFVGGGWIEGNGAVIWRILVDGSAPPGANSYAAILASLGSPANPVDLPGGFRVFENQVVQIVANNVSVAVAGQLVGGRLIGYLYPREMEEANLWI